MQSYLKYKNYMLQLGWELVTIEWQSLYKVYIHVAMYIHFVTGYILATLMHFLFKTSRIIIYGHAGFYKDRFLYNPVQKLWSWLLRLYNNINWFQICYQVFTALWKGGKRLKILDLVSTKGLWYSRNFHVYIVW